MPALYIAGDQDLVVAFPGTAEHIANMKKHVPHLRDIQMFPAVAIGPSNSALAEVSTAIMEFLPSLPN